mmetsp:Transcript_119749/g.238490  ORF Transcript_119749/g.238490 Transcript_119749/m.238490 type:complete len:576 (-) Transcript_119749:36-1763(-)
MLRGLPLWRCAVRRIRFSGFVLLGVYACLIGLYGALEGKAWAAHRELNFLTNIVGCAQIRGSSGSLTVAGWQSRWHRQQHQEKFLLYHSPMHPSSVFVRSSAKPERELQSQCCADSLQWTPQATKFRLDIVQRIWQPGTPMEQLKQDVEIITSNAQRERTVVSLLSELASATDLGRSAELQKLIRKAWLFHESADIANQLQMGLGCLDADDVQGAKDKFEKVVDADPTFAEGWKKLASVKYMLDDYTGALAASEKALALEPAHFGALVGMGLVLQKLGRPEEAAHATRSASRVHPMSPRLRANLFLSDVSNLVLVSPNFLPALGELAPQMGLVVITLCVLFDVAFGASGVLGRTVSQDLSGQTLERQVVMSRESRNLPDGTFELRTELQITTPTGAPLKELKQDVNAVRSGRDRYVLSQRLLDELGAAQTNQRAKALVDLIWDTWYFHQSPEVSSLIMRGEEAMSAGQLADAEQLFAKATQLDPRYSEAWNRLATVHYLMGKYEASLNDIDITLELEPRHFGALYGRGLVLQELGQFEEAAAWFREGQVVVPISGNYAAAAAEADAVAKALASRD